MLEELQQALSIKFSRSEDSQDYDLSFDKENCPRVKCFRCYGTHQLNCQECHGAETVSYYHPLAQLLDEVLTRKLNLGRSEEEREEERETVEPIKEEEEDSEEKKGKCSVCDQCQYSCICRNSAVSRDFPMTQMRLTDGFRHMTQAVRLSSVTVELDDKTCMNCNSRLQNCYSVCKSCQSSGEEYWICDQCSDNSAYNHDQSHILEPVIHFQHDNRTRMEQIFGEEEHEHSETYHQSQTAQVEQVKQISHPVLSITSSIQINHQTLERSSIGIQLDGLFNSCQIQCQLRSTTIQNHKQTSYIHLSDSRPAIFKSATYRNNKQNMPLATTDYCFIDYRCDNCREQPILNVRFHCSQCQDFDLCHNCHTTSNHSHPFLHIDGRLLREKAMQKLLHFKEPSYLLQRTSTKSTNPRQLYA